jgi:hypothetical protein
MCYINYIGRRKQRREKMLSLSKIQELARQPRQDDENGRSALYHYITTLPPHLHDTAFALFCHTPSIQDYTLDGLIKRCMRSASTCTKYARKTEPYKSAQAAKANVWRELSESFVA